ncbi:MAG: chromosomal replication initiator protein DnaA [Lachnospira sp.]|nr:chromosomal replication initiator protein DnaA [Lachnospira sp.]
MDELKAKWNDILEAFRQDFEIQNVSFSTWIKPLKLYSLEGNTVILVSDEDPQVIDYIRRKYKKPLKVAISEVMGREYDLEITSVKEIKSARTNSTEEQTRISKAASEMSLNPNYTFSNFIVGTNNNLAHAASLAVAETPGEVYNPLFIYGGVGLGKTHLMQAIAHFILEHRPELKVLYVTSETFTNELIDSVKNGRNFQFRAKYRNIDVLLIDDIQFIIGKEATQEEFFHTFNDLYQNNKQIVITSDKPPKEMETLTERLRTRFEMGLPVDIQIPTYETKMAILNKKCDMKGLDIPADVKDFIATHIKSNIRELEGSLTKLSFYSNLTHEKITLPVAQEALKDLISPESSREITPDLIVKIVADHFNLTPDAILSQSRNAELNYARQIVMYLCRQMTTATQKQIGDLLGRDHSTIKHGVDKIAKDILTDSSTRDTVNVLIKKIDPS